MKPETLIIAMIAALFGVGLLTGSGDEEGEDEPAAQDQAAHVEEVARKLERVRKLRFKEIPEVRTVTAEEARAEGLEAFDEEYPPERRQSDEEVLELLGLLEPDTELRDVAGSIFGEEVAGYYDQDTKQMTLVGEGDPEDIILAHELTHALEDQHFGLADEEDALDDELSARTALYEGTATVAMVDYLGGSSTRERLLRQFDLVDLFSSSNLPPYFEHSLVFPYVAGARFVNAIGTWGPANRALRSRRPVSTEQVIHPEKYEAGEEPLEVNLAPPFRKGTVPKRKHDGWERVSHGTVGEFDTAELIRTSDSLARAERAAAGWGGGSYALWHRGEESLLRAAWRFDTRRDAAEFLGALSGYVERTLDGDAKVSLGKDGRIELEIARG
jgi:hypothetical protein